MRNLLVLLLISLTAACVLAQPDPNHPQPEPRNKPKAAQPPRLPAQKGANSAVTVEVTPFGLFVVSGGMLAKYDPVTVKPLGTLQLLEPLPDAAAANKNNKALRDWRQDLNRRLHPPVVLPQGEVLFIVTGDRFFRVNQQTLAIEMKAELFDGEAGKEPALPLLAPFFGKVNGQTLYLLRGSEVFALDTTTGKVLGRSPLPKEMLLQDAARLPEAVAQPEKGRDIVVVGTLVNHAKLEKGCWSLKSDDGNEYVLTGDQANKLAVIPKAAGRRVRITGLFFPGPNIYQIGIGVIQVTKYEIVGAK
ncbi:MAG: hypothetical protein ACYDBB_03870 [Armatimonadota bacterium]